MIPPPTRVEVIKKEINQESGIIKYNFVNGNERKILDQNQSEWRPFTCSVMPVSELTRTYDHSGNKLQVSFNKPVPFIVSPIGSKEVYDDELGVDLFEQRGRHVVFDNIKIIECATVMWFIFALMCDEMKN